MKNQYELRQTVTDYVKLDIVYQCVGIVDTLKSLFGFIYKHGLIEDPSYLRKEMRLAKHTLAIMEALVGDTDDEKVIEAKAYLIMLVEEYEKES